MQTPDPSETVYQTQGNLWLVAGIPALLIIGYLIYSAVKQSDAKHPTSDGSEVSESAPGERGDK